MKAKMQKRWEENNQRIRSLQSVPPVRVVEVEVPSAISQPIRILSSIRDQNDDEDNHDIELDSIRSLVNIIESQVVIEEPQPSSTQHQEVAVPKSDDVKSLTKSKK